MENIIIASGSKEEKYRTLIPQIKALLEGEIDPVARMSNAAAAIQETFGFLWTGFYRVVKKPGSNVEASERTDVEAGEKDCGSHEESCELAVGPFQGPVACSRIKQHQFGHRQLTGYRCRLHPPVGQRKHISKAYRNRKLDGNEKWPFLAGRHGCSGYRQRSLRDFRRD